MRRASNAPGSEDLAYSDTLVSGQHWHLPGDLLQQGERAAVVEFLERMADTNVAHRLALRETASALRRGENPVALKRGEL